ncbi:MAG: hypothetical protein ABIH26_05110, partial [Candidatus Eisenbacteria bacterium]
MPEADPEPAVETRARARLVSAQDPASVGKEEAKEIRDNLADPVWREAETEDAWRKQLPTTGVERPPCWILSGDAPPDQVPEIFLVRGKNYGIFANWHIGPSTPPNVTVEPIRVC